MCAAEHSGVTLGDRTAARIAIRIAAHPEFQAALEQVWEIYQARLDAASPPRDLRRTSVPDATWHGTAGSLGTSDRHIAAEGRRDFGSGGSLFGVFSARARIARCHWSRQMRFALHAGRVGRRVPAPANTNTRLSAARNLAARPASRPGPSSR